VKPDLFALQFVMSVLAESVAGKQQHAMALVHGSAS
jgi:hypothetical protein